MPAPAHPRPPTLPGLALLVATLLLSACSSKYSMMPAPLTFQRTGMPAHASMSADQPSTTLPILFATNREPGSTDDIGPTYGSSRSPHLRLGHADVRIGPDDWDAQRLHRELLSGAQPTMSVTQIQEFGLLDPPADASAPIDARPSFARELDQSLAATPSKDIVIYVPGFNIDFNTILLRVAELSHFSARNAVFIAFAWPAHDNPFFYDQDARSAIESVDAFTDLISFLSSSSDARRIHILTSSAGAPIVSGALAALHARTIRPVPAASPRLGRVIFAAPDQDARQFLDLLASGQLDLCEHITVYSSRSDLGLILSRFLGSGKSSLGRLPANLCDADTALLRSHAHRVTVIDATDAVGHAGRGDLWAHRYWSANAWVSSDILAALASDKPPAARGLVTSPNTALWYFPDNYPAHLQSRDQTFLPPSPAPAPR